MSGNAANFPATANALGKIIQTTDGNYTETYQIPNTPGPYTHLLGKNLTPALPTGWQDVPLGAYPINPPGAVTIGTPGGFNTPGGFLTAAGVYKVAMTNVTDYGETVVGTITTFTLGATFTAANYALPSVSQGTADAPIRRRRLYRSAAGGSSLFLVAEIADLNQLTYVDGMADAFLLTAPPSVNGSGAIGSVTISGGGHAAGYWAEVAPGTGLVGGQYIVDYSTGTTGGTITHAAADANLASVQAQFTAGTLASATVVNNIIQALQDMSVAVLPLSQKDANSGVPSLDINGHVNQAPVHGIRQSIRWDLDADGTGDITVDTAHQHGNTGLFSDYFNPKQFTFTTTGGDIEMSFFGWPWNYLSTANWFLMAVSLDAGPAFLLASGHTGAATSQFDTQTSTTGATALFGGSKVFRNIAAGSHTIYLLLQAGGSGGVTSAGFKKGANVSWFSASVKELA